MNTGWRSHDRGEVTDATTATANAARAVEQRLLTHGHGSAAIVVFQRLNGNVHALNAVNHEGRVYWIDGQYGRVSDRPLYEGRNFISIELDPGPNPSTRCRSSPSPAT
ncbi:toxin glutamine deamidase domain-containing protein [Streptomyces sp. M19]